MNKIFIILAIQSFCFLTHAKLFTNSYVSFQLPPNWNCKVAGTEWVCRSSNADQARQAIIVLTAKEMGPNDNFAYYNQYLKTPKTPKNRDGSVATMSKVQHLKSVQINSHNWVDGLQLGSLLPNFYSRYLVTVKEKIAILVTFSAKKEYYTQYSKAFFDAINSLKVTVVPGGPRGNIKSANEVLGVDDLNAHMDENDWSEDQGAVSEDLHKGAGNMLIYGLALVLAGAGVFFLIKKKRKR